VSLMPDLVRMFWTLVLLSRVEASSNIDLSWAVVSSLRRGRPIYEIMVKICPDRDI
jgi:hypothetical protein